MRRRLVRFEYSLWLGMCFMFVGLQYAQAQENNQQTVCENNKVPIAEIVTVVGYVSKLSNGEEFQLSPLNGSITPEEFETETQKNLPITKNRNICANDTISTFHSSQVIIQFKTSKTFLTLDNNAVYTVKTSPSNIIAESSKPKSIDSLSDGFFSACKNVIKSLFKSGNNDDVDLEKGRLRIFTENPRKFNVTTDYLNASVEGTEFVVTVNENNTTTVDVYEGSVSVCNNDPESELAFAGDRAYATSRDNLEIQRQFVNPKDAVQWTLYYPPVGTTTGDFKDIYKLANQGEAKQAKDQLENLKTQKTNLSEVDPYVLALLSSIELTQNELDLAKENASQAVKNAISQDKQFTAAYMALSYVQQAEFDLRGALKSVETAKESGNKADSLTKSLLLSRQAELQLALGNKKSANEIAIKARDKDPTFSRPHTVLGFTHLSLFELDEAAKSFGKAIELNETDPDPYIGLGLVAVRRGNTEEAIKQKAIAVNLSPGYAIARSYLGKTYFHNDNYDKALTQFDLAEAVDKNDPTPNLYRAFVYQSNNQPVKALEDLQKSIEKNENRAVYRSRLGLDEDLAVRSASAARIYDELGFDQLTVLEGAKSLAHDPGNYSAHRLMADAYLNRPRHEIARVSELLQSQIRQPLNNNPAQVQLSDSRLGAFRDSGPFDVSFNEFSRLYTEKGFSGRIGIVAGENSTWGDEVQFSNLSDNFSITATHYNFETDGERLNADEDNKLYGLFVQYQLPNNVGLQAEIQKSEIVTGETYRGFDSEDFNPDYRFMEDVDSYRFSVSHKLTSDQEILFNYRREDFNQDLLNIDDAPFVQFDRFFEIDSELFEVTYIKQSDLVDVIVGAGSAKQERTEIFPDENFILDIDHKNYYLYSYPKFKHHKYGSFDFVVGLSYDNFDDIDIGTKETNPKFGIAWNHYGLTARAAIFETLKRTLVADETLEPTNIVGFNQFYDDFDATRSKVYGLGLDYKLDFENSSNLNSKYSINNIYMGIETLKRDLNVPGFIFGEVQREDISERFTKLYAYIPIDSWSFGINYENEHFDRKFLFELDEQIIDLKTDRIGFEIKYFQPEGFRYSLETTYIKQDADLIDRFFEEYSGSDSFWTADASIGYLFSKIGKYKNIKGIVSLEIKNLFDQEFNYQDTAPLDSRFSQDREVFLQAQFNF